MEEIIHVNYGTKLRFFFQVLPIKIDRSGMPKDVLGRGGSGLTASALKRFDLETGAADAFANHDTRTLVSRVSELSIRNKHETLQEKRDRKKAFREHKRERRLEKKANQQAFKDEKQLQSKNEMNNRNNVQGVKIV